MLFIIKDQGNTNARGAEEENDLVDDELTSGENDVEYAELYEEIPSSSANGMVQSTDEFDDFMSLPISSLSTDSLRNGLEFKPICY